jgi:tight adherence protein B
MTMRANLLIPVVLLLIVLIGAVFALLVDSRKTRLLRRVEELVPSRDAIGGPSGRGPDIRAGREPGRQIGSLVMRFLRVPADMPAAHVMAPRIVWSAGAIVAVATGLVGLAYVSVLQATGLGLVAGVLLLRTVFGWERSRYCNALVRQLPDAIELVVSATRAGLPIREAFRGIADEMPTPTNLEFGRIVNEMALGVPPEDALLSLHRRTRVSEYAIFAVTIGVQIKSGGRLAETIQTLAETVRQRLAMAARAHALASEARTSAVILASLPFVGGALLSAINPGYLNPLFHDTRGLRMLTYAAMGVVFGIWAMRQMIVRATRE